MRLLFILVFITLKSFSQSAIICVIDKNNTLQKVDYVKPNLKYTLNIKPENISAYFNNARKCEINFDINHITELYILGANILIEPNDTIQIEVLAKPNNEIGYFFSITSKYKGNLLWRNKLKKYNDIDNENNNLKVLQYNDYKKLAYSNYIKLQDSLNDFSTKYSISEEGKKIFLRELYYNYLRQLCNKFQQKDNIEKYNNNYFSEFNYSNFNDTILLKTSSIYRQALQSYYGDITEGFPTMLNYLDSSVFKKQVQKITKFTNSITKDYLYAQVAYYYYVMKNDLNDNVNHLTTIKNEVLNLISDINIKSELLLLDKNEFKKITDFDYKNLKKIKLINIQNQKIDLFKITKKYSNSVIVLDIWASWCLPCLNELNYYPNLINKFNGLNVIVIPISIDENKMKWVSKNKEIPEVLQKGYCLQDKISISNFRQLFSITEIPRTILFGKNNLLINFYGSSPSEGELLIHQIEGALNK